MLGDRRRVAGLLVGALKRAAEAGNDLFGSLLTVQERRDTADTGRGSACSGIALPFSPLASSFCRIRRLMV